MSLLSLKQDDKSLRHPDHKRLFEREGHSLIRPDLVDTVENILFALDEAMSVQALAIPRYRLHPLKGEFKGYWSVTVKANWRIIFRFEEDHAYDVELLESHKADKEKTAMPMKNPPHPGRIVRQDCIEVLELTVTKAATLLGVTRQALNNLVNERAGISAEMAIRLEKLGWSTADHWIRLQAAYDLAQARRMQDQIKVERHEPHHA